jgi:hypothetical protein
VPSSPALYHAPPNVSPLSLMDTIPSDIFHLARTIPHPDTPPPLSSLARFAPVCLVPVRLRDADGTFAARLGTLVPDPARSPCSSMPSVTTMTHEVHRLAELPTVLRHRGPGPPELRQPRGALEPRRACRGCFVIVAIQ